MNRRIVDIYRSSREEGLYLYVDKAEQFSRVPEELLQGFGKAELAMTLELHHERKLARANTTSVLQALETNGFYLQLPPLKENPAP